MATIKRHMDLDVYQLAFKLAIEIHQITKNFPNEEKYSLTDQIRRSSRSVCANIAEAWRKRKYEKAFIAKLSDCEAEAAETQTWLDFAFEFQYINEEIAMINKSPIRMIFFISWRIPSDLSVKN